MPNRQVYTSILDLKRLYKQDYTSQTTGHDAWSNKSDAKRITIVNYICSMYVHQSVRSLAHSTTWTGNKLPVQEAPFLTRLCMLTEDFYTDNYFYSDKLSTLLTVIFRVKYAEILSCYCYSRTAERIDASLVALYVINLRQILNALDHIIFRIKTITKNSIIP